MYTSQLTAATTNDPVTVDVGGDSRLYATISRGDKPSRGRFRLVALEEAGPPRNEFIVSCDTGWRAPPASHSASTFALGTSGPDRVSWRLQLFEEGAIADGANEPLRVAIAPATVPDWRQSTAFRDTTKPRWPPSPCIRNTFGLLTDVNKRQDQLVEGSTAQLADTVKLLTGVTTLRYLKGGAHFAFRGQFTPGTPSARVYIKLAVKGDGPGPFNGFCEFHWPGPFEQNDMHFEGDALGDDNFDARIWRIEIRVEPPLPADFPSPTLVFTMSSSMPSVVPNRGMSFEYLCQPTSVTDASAVASTWSSDARSDVSLLSFMIDDPGSQLTSNARTELRTEVLAAIALWRSSCSGCAVDALAAAEIDHHVFVSSSLIPVLNSPSFEQLLSPAGKPAYEGLSQLLRAGPDTKQPPFQILDPSSAAAVNVCAIVSPNRPEVIRNIQSKLGCRQAASDGVSPPVSPPFRIRVSSAPNDCGADKNVIACEKPLGTATLNTQDYSFIRNDLSIVVGAGSIKIPLLHVLLHEVGHSMGLGHLNSWGNMMEQTLADSRCLDGIDDGALRASLLKVGFGTTPPTAFYNAPLQLVGELTPKPPEVTSPEMKELESKPAHFKLTQPPQH